MASEPGMAPEGEEVVMARSAGAAMPQTSQVVSRKLEAVLGMQPAEAHPNPTRALVAASAPRSVLSLDVGRKRIGLAGCDALGLTVKALPALHRGRYPADLERPRHSRKSGGSWRSWSGSPSMPSSSPPPKPSTVAAMASVSPGI